MSNLPLTLLAVAGLGLGGFGAYSAYSAHQNLDVLRDQNATLMESLEKTSAKLSDQGTSLNAAASAESLAALEDTTVALSERVLNLESTAAEPFGTRVRSALMSEPAMLFEAVAEYERLQIAEQAAIYADDLNDDPYIPVLGNPDGDVTLVEFFDYNCGYCRRAYGDVMELVEADGNIRLILKEFPVLSEQSREAAVVAVSAAALGLDYNTLHRRAMEGSGTMDADAMLQIVADMGGDRAAVEADVATNRGAYLAALARTQQVGQGLGVTGTPAFYIEGTVIPGAVGKDQLAAVIAQVRETANTPSSDG